MEDLAKTIVEMVDNFMFVGDSKDTIIEAVYRCN